MVLSDKRILEEMARGNIVIEPFDERQLGTNSYDVRLGEWYYEPNRNLVLVDFFDEESMRAFWGEPKHAQDGYIIIRAGDTILAHTQEVVGARNGFTTSMRCRSSIGRSALSVCKCSGLGDVGYIARWTMEITNHSQAHIRLPVGARIAQIMFYEVGPTLREYRGKYGQQTTWTPEEMLPRLSQDWDLPLFHPAFRRNGASARSS
ncbi:MAG: dCTP deaminase [Chloroflexi bacterium]|nr:dCTP deaminase [Chloroflexota bacterium]GIW11444.1 MAG: dCTP deaminase [Dehalococcoidia bacterium]